MQSLENPISLNYPLICVEGNPGHRRPQGTFKHEKGHSFNRIFADSLHEKPTRKEPVDNKGVMNLTRRKKTVWGSFMDTKRLKSVNPEANESIVQELVRMASEKGIAEAKKSIMENSYLVRSR